MSGGTRVAVIGGGLAGMVAADELACRGVRVVILEKGTRLGGKAGADWSERHGYEDHGYHVFPGWYRNVRRLLAGLDPAPRLIDIERFHYLRRGGFPEFLTVQQTHSPLRDLRHNLTCGLANWPELCVALYSVLDLASRPFDDRRFLDRVSALGWLRSRFYASDTLAELEHRNFLQASSIPSYEISAKTAQKIAQVWMQTRTPFLSILDGDLQTRFIAPFEQRLRKRGVEIRLGCRVGRLRVTEGISGLDDADGAPLENLDDVAAWVVATPLESALELVSQPVWLRERCATNVPEDRKLLSELVHLRSAPMAGMQLYLRHKLQGIPAAHVNLLDSRTQTSFVDISQHWRGLGRTVLSIIAADFAPLAPLDRDAMARFLLEELYEFLPIRDADVDDVTMLPHLGEPLFLNTVAAWHFRPATRTRIANLYVAGDYCRSEADLTTMESAVQSGLATAAAVLQDLGAGDLPAPLPLPVPPRWKLVLLRTALLAPIAVLDAYTRIRSGATRTNGAPGAGA